MAKINDQLKTYNQFEALLCSAFSLCKNRTLVYHSTTHSHQNQNRTSFFSLLSLKNVTLVHLSTTHSHQNQNQTSFFSLLSPKMEELENLQRDFQSEKSADGMFRLFQRIENLGIGDLGMASWRGDDVRLLPMLAGDKEPKQVVSFGQKALKFYIDNGSMFVGYRYRCMLSNVFYLMSCAYYDLGEFEKSLGFMNFSRLKLLQVEQEKVLSESFILDRSMEIERVMAAVKTVLRRREEIPGHLDRMTIMMMIRLDPSQWKHRLVGDLHKRIYQAYFDIFDFASAYPSCLKAFEIYSEHFGNTSKEALLVVITLSKICFHLGKYNEALQHNVLAMGVLRYEFANRDQMRFDLLLDRGKILFHLGKYKEALQLLNTDVVKPLQQGTQNDVLAMAYVYLGMIYSKQGKIEKAIESITRGRGDFDTIDVEHPELDTRIIVNAKAALGFLEISKFYELMDNYESALSFAGSALKITQLPRALLSLIARKIRSLIVQTDREKQWIHYLRATLEKLKSAFGLEHIEVVQACNALGDIHLRSGNPELAEKFHNIALRSQSKLTVDKAAGEDFLSKNSHTSEDEMVAKLEGVKLKEESSSKSSARVSTQSKEDEGVYDTDAETAELQRAFICARSAHDMFSVFKKIEQKGISNFSIKTWDQEMAPKFPEEKKPEEVLSFCKRALQFYIDNKGSKFPGARHWVIVANIVSLLGAAYFELGDFDASLSFSTWCERNLLKIEQDESYPYEFLASRIHCTEIRIYRTLKNLGRSDDAPPHLMKMLKALIWIEEQMGDHQAKLQLGNGYMFTAQAYMTVLDFKAALPLYEKALPIYENDDENVARIRKNLEHIYVNLGRYEDALREYGLAQSAFEKVGKPLPVTLRLDRGISLVYLDRYDDAIKDLRVVIDEGKRAQRITAYVYMAMIYHKKSKEDQVKSYIKRLISLEEADVNSAGETIRYWAATTFLEISQLYVMMDDFQTALSYVGRALQIPQLPRALLLEIAGKLQSSLIIQNDKEEKGNLYLQAMSHLEATVQKLKEKLGPEHAELLKYYSHLKDIYLDLGNEESAEKYRNEAEGVRLRNQMQVAKDGGKVAEDFLSKNSQFETSQHEKVAKLEDKLKVDKAGGEATEPPVKVSEQSKDGEDEMVPKLEDLKLEESSSSDVTTSRASTHTKDDEDT